MAKIYMVGMTPVDTDLLGSHETLARVAYTDKGDAQAACDRLSRDDTYSSRWVFDVVPVELFSRT
jgi:hypothetical protein